MGKGKYDGTLNLPKTDFPMRANLPKREPEIEAFWETSEIYRQVQEKNQGRPLFILHDGPPYANGDIHLGHVLNKVLKDMIVKQKSMTGFNSPYVPGWDTHGLPIEQQAIKNMGLDRHKTDVVEFRNYCKEYALKYLDIQRQQFKRLGVRGDWENPYITLAPDFEAVQIKVFGEMAKKGYIYKGLQPVYWCGECETALAEAEIEYADRVSPSIYVKFPVKDGRGLLPEDAFIIIWTTTPWTIPANTGIAVHPDFEYVLVEVAAEKYLLAKGLLEEISSELNWNDYEVIEQYEGTELEKVICQHPFFDRESLVILGTHVTLEAGTGCVHTAPGHGEEDFYAGQEYGLEIISPIDNKGNFTDEAGKFAGLYVHDANGEVVKELDDRGMLLKQSEYQHQYPHCWRCKNPIIYRATEQWFASVDGFRQDTLKAIDNVRWIPAWGRERIYNMVKDRRDWCVSRQRTWGVPIPIFYCESCGIPIINDETIENVSNLFAENGSDIWFIREAKELLPAGFECPECGGAEFSKESDIMDVWFDSGSSHMAVLETRADLRWPAEMYLEGSDQHRGWFNSSLSTSVAVRGVAPYKNVLTHGFVVDEDGHKMSKSLGNVIDPLKLIKEMGADILRLWVASADYRNDISVSKNIIRQSAEAYRKIRNTCRFILGNLFDFDPDRDKVEYEKLTELDKWVLLKLDKLTRRVNRAYEEYEFHVVFHAVHNFCTIELSNIYFDILKDKLYCSHPDDPQRRAAQTALNEVINTLVIMLTPILAFTTEEIWRYLRSANQPKSVQLMDFIEPKDEYMKKDLEIKTDKILEVREVVTKALETARGKKTIGHSLGAWIIIYADEKWYKLLNSTDDIDKIFIVSQADLQKAEKRTGEFMSLEHVPGVWVEVKAAAGEKCERCWVIDKSVGDDQEYVTLCSRCARVVKELQ